MGNNFKELNDNLNSIMEKIITNQNLCKLLLFEESPLSQPDIESPQDLLYTNIFPYPYDISVLENSMNLLIVGFDDFRPISSNNFISKNLYFRILCHRNLWRTDSGLRPYLIAQEIAEMFNNQRVIGIGKTLFEGGRELWANKDYIGFSLVYEIIDFS